MKKTGIHGWKTVAAALAWSLFSAAFGFAQEERQWKKQADSVALTQGEHTIWQFNYPVKPGGKPYFHPVALPGGSSLTWLSPPDHVWHLALWFSWKFINQVNYWEVNKQGFCDGLTEWSKVKVETRANHSARLRLDVQYRPQQTKRPILTEKRTIEISAPAADGSYAMDWTMVFTAGQENINFDRTPSTEQSISGYAGLSARLAKELTDIRIEATADKGKSIGDRYGYPATATDFNGRIDDREAGIAMLDHPANPRHPNRWYVITEAKIPFWYINAAWLQSAAYDLPARKSITLRYRLLVHPGRWQAKELEEAFRRYTK